MIRPDEIFDNSDTEAYSELDPVNFFDTEEPNESEFVLEVEDNGEPDFDYVDEGLNDIDFSQLSGPDFKSSLKQLHGKLHAAKPKIKKVSVKKPLSQRVGIKGSATIFGKQGNNGTRKTTQRISVPREREVIIKTVDKFMLDTKGASSRYKNIGYYKGKKLKELILTINNNSGVDFTFELFNQSMPLDYMFSNAQNMNNLIKLGSGNGASYTDMVLWMIGNPTLIPSARIITNGPSQAAQQQESMYFKNKNIAGELYVEPMNLGQELDTMQFQASTIDFDITNGLNRPFIPDGMDVIRYKVFAGNTVTMCFYYKSKKLKKILWKEARDKKTLM